MDKRFKPGDIVRFKGGQDEWTIEWISIYNNVGLSFGKTIIETDMEVLELVRRPGRKEIRTVELWANVYPEFMAAGHQSKELADMYALEGRIDCVKIIKSYEVEIYE